MSSFEFRDRYDSELSAFPGGTPDAPTVVLYTRQSHSSANAYIPVDRVEEVVAGLRDMARQAGGPAPEPLTEAELAAGQADADFLAAVREPEPRRFYLYRHDDITGVSGEGQVADGILWPDGTASVRWRGEHPSIVFWDRGQLSVDHIHGHHGATEIVWVDEP